MLSTMLVATPGTACVTSMLVSTVVVWRLILVSGLPSPRRSTRLLHLLVATIATVVCPGLVWYVGRQYAWTEWNKPMSPFAFVAGILIFSGFIVVQTLFLLRDLFSPRPLRVRRPS